MAPSILTLRDFYATLGLLAWGLLFSHAEMIAIEKYFEDSISRVLMHEKDMYSSRFCRRCCSSDSETKVQMMMRFAFASEAPM